MGYWYLTAGLLELVAAISSGIAAKRGSRQVSAISAAIAFMGAVLLTVPAIFLGPSSKATATGYSSVAYAAVPLALIGVIVLGLGAKRRSGQLMVAGMIILLLDGLAAVAAAFAIIA